MPLLKRFYQDPYLHIRSFVIHSILITLACVGLWQWHAPEFYSYQFETWHLALLVPGMYAAGISAVFMHNATHGSFRPRWMNVVAGELAGLHELWGFTGWKLIHLVHHMYSDDVEHDPHPPKGLTFWQFARIMFVYSSAKITQRYREHWGDTKRTRLLQSATKIVFVYQAAATLLLWFLLLGPVGFLWFYIPSYVGSYLVFCDINYFAHPKEEDGSTAPGNMNDTLYYKLANFFWFGIYFHGNHHRRPHLFNPRKMVETPRRARQELVEEAA